MKAITKPLVAREEFERFRKALLAIIIDGDRKSREETLARVRELVGVDPTGEADWVPVSDLAKAQTKTGEVLVQREKLRQGLSIAIGLLEGVRPYLKSYGTTAQRLQEHDDSIKALREVQTV